jgi:hypothetical protein
LRLFGFPERRLESFSSDLISFLMILPADFGAAATRSPTSVAATTTSPA